MMSLIGVLLIIFNLLTLQGHLVIYTIVSVVRLAAPLIIYFTISFLATLITEVANVDGVLLSFSRAVRSGGLTLNREEGELDPDF